MWGAKRAKREEQEKRTGNVAGYRQPEPKRIMPTQSTTMAAGAGSIAQGPGKIKNHPGKPDGPWYDALQVD